MSEGFWYLATPYSKYPAGREAAYREACKQTALLVKAKVPVFCPIAHTHGPGETGLVGNDLETWLVADRPFMDAAKGLIICTMDSWDQSDGIAAELDVFAAARKPIIYMVPGYVPWQLLSLGHEETVPILGPDLDADGNLVVLYDEAKPCICDTDYREDHCARCGRGVGNGCMRAERDELGHTPGWEARSEEAWRVANDSAQRKATPICTGVLDYFPDALSAVARVSRIGNDKHNPGEPLHWSRGKSADHADCILRHMRDRGTLDDDGELHDAKVAWRALAQLQLAEEKRRG